MQQSAPATDIPRLGQGNITIKVGERTLTLKPSINAATQLSRQYNGLVECASRASRLDLDCVIDIVTLGLGPPYDTNLRMRKELTEQLFLAGFSDDTGGIASAAVKFVHILIRGGRPPKADEDEVANTPGENGAAPNPQMPN